MPTADMDTPRRRTTLLRSLLRSCFVAVIILEFATWSLGTVYPIDFTWAGLVITSSGGLFLTEAFKLTVVSHRAERMGNGAVAASP
jgi:hypothetical protein